MKTKIKLSALLFIASITVSCDNFLEEKNQSNITAENYFVTADGYRSLVNAAYSTLRTVWGDEPWLYCLGTDIFTRGESELIGGSYGGRDTQSRQLNEYAELDAENPCVKDHYADLYYSIQACNTALARANAVNGISETEIVQSNAEVRFLRAYYYFLLVEQFGDVPLVEDEITSAITHFDRIPEADIYKYIINELSVVVSKLPIKAAEFGRATQGACKNLLSLVYLTRGYKSYADSDDFTKAASLADEVINSGEYRLLPSFQEVFKEGNEINDEIIFSVQYDAKSLGGDINNGSGQNAMFGWELWSKIPSGFEIYNTTYNWHKPQFTPTQFLYSLYNTDSDSRYDVTFLSEYYATKDDGKVKAGDLRVYFPHYDKEFTVNNSLAIMAEHPNAIIITKELWKQDIENIGGSGIFPMIWKFFDSTAPWPSNNQSYSGTRDIFLFRLAETYLIASEAYLQAGDKSKAAERLNAVRKRAAIPGHEKDMIINEADIDINTILDERARELAGEYKRWPDLKRTNTLIERTLKHNNLAKKTNKMDNHILLRPIPQTVIDQDSEGIEQNAGY